MSKECLHATLKSGEPHIEIHRFLIIQSCNSFVIEYHTVVSGGGAHIPVTCSDFSYHKLFFGLETFTKTHPVIEKAQKDFRPPQLLIRIAIAFLKFDDKSIYTLRRLDKHKVIAHTVKSLLMSEIGKDRRSVRLYSEYTVLQLVSCNDSAAHICIRLLKDVRLMAEMTVVKCQLVFLKFRHYPNSE